MCIYVYVHIRKTLIKKESMNLGWDTGEMFEEGEGEWCSNSAHTQSSQKS